MNCPVCSLAMTQEVHDAVTVDLCPQHGLWLDHAELLLLTEAKRSGFRWADLFRSIERPPSDPERSLPCPKCAKVMALEDYHSVTIDWCRTDGVWLDSGELDAILNNLRLDPAYLRGIVVRLLEARY